MKKITILLILLISTTAIYAQKLHYRKIYEDGITLRTEYMPLSSNGQKTLFCALRYETHEDPEMNSGYSILIQFLDRDSHLNVPQEGKLLIRTSKGDILSLTQTLPLNGFLQEISPSRGWKDTGQSHNGFARYINDIAYYQTTSQYYISDEDLDKIVKDGIIKIRIQTTGESIECNYPVSEFIKVKREKQEVNKAADMFSKLFTVLYNNIDPYTNF